MPVCIVCIAGAGDDDTELWNYVSYGNDMAAVDDGEAIRGLPDMTGVRRPLTVFLLSCHIWDATYG